MRRFRHNPGPWCRAGAAGSRRPPVPLPVALLRGAVLVLSCALVWGAAAQEVEGEGTSSPFALHAGAAYARVPDADFEVLQGLAGQELFTQTQAQNDRADFVVLLSQRLWAKQDAGVRAYASLGTALDDPGSVLYFGGSLAVSRAFVTLGIATSLIEEGVDGVPDEVFRGAGDRTLFAGLQQRREWGFFAAVSFGILQ